MTATEDATSPNFGFLAKGYPELERIAARSERYFSGDPVVSLITLRQFGEALAQLVAARSGLYIDQTSASAICSGVSASTEGTRQTYWAFLINCVKSAMPQLIITQATMRRRLNA
jgi:hypothetical protein